LELLVNEIQRRPLLTRIVVEFCRDPAVHCRGDLFVGALRPMQYATRFAGIAHSSCFPPPRGRRHQRVSGMQKMTSLSARSGFNCAFQRFVDLQLLSIRAYTSLCTSNDERIALSRAQCPLFVWNIYIPARLCIWNMMSMQYCRKKKIAIRGVPKPQIFLYLYNTG
jgi:hypothetical protein